MDYLEQATQYVRGLELIPLDIRWPEIFPAEEVLSRGRGSAIEIALASAYLFEREGCSPKLMIIRTGRGRTRRHHPFHFYERLMLADGEESRELVIPALNDGPFLPGRNISPFSSFSDLINGLTNFVSDLYGGRYHSWGEADLRDLDHYGIDWRAGADKNGPLNLAPYFMWGLKPEEYEHLRRDPHREEAARIVTSLITDLRRGKGVQRTIDALMIKLSGADKSI